MEIIVSTPIDRTQTVKSHVPVEHLNVHNGIMMPPTVAIFGNNIVVNQMF